MTAIGSLVMTMLLFATTAVTAGWGPAGGARAAAAPLGEYASRLSFTLTDLDPLVVTSAGADLVTVTGQYRNTGANPIGDLSYRFQRGNRLTTAAAVQAEAAQPTQPVAVINPTFRPLPGTLAPGRSVTFSVSAPVTGNAAESLGITTPGVYPLMINVNGTVRTPGGDVQARVGEAHLLLTVASLPGVVAGAPAGAAPAPVGILWPLVDTPHLGVDGVFRDDQLAAEVQPGGRLANALDMLLNGTADPNLVTLAIDPMLLDELNRMSQGYWVSASPTRPQPALRPAIPSPTPGSTPSRSAPSVAPSAGSAGASAGSPQTAQPPGTAPSTGGEAGSGAPSALSAPPAPPAPGSGEGPATMTQTPGTSASARAGESAGTGTTLGAGGAPPTPSRQPQQQPAAGQSGSPGPGRPPDTVPGVGQAAATAFLAELRGLAATHAVLVLPYGDPDVVALARAGMTEAIATAVYRGRAIAANVLGQGLDTPNSPSNLVTDVAAPPGGVLTDQAWQVLRSLGYTSAILAPSGVRADGKSGTATGFVTVSIKGDEVPAVVSGGGHAPAFAQVLQDGAPAHWASSVNTLAADLMVEGGAGTGPMVVVPPRTFGPPGAGFAALATTLDDLSLVGMVLPMPVTAMARGGEPDSSDGSAQALAAAPQSAVLLNYSAAARAAELPPAYLSALQQIRHHLDVLGQTLGGTTTGPNPADILDPLADTMLGAVSASWRGRHDPDGLVLHTVEDTIALLYQGVRIARDTGSYTLASSTAPLLLTVHNTLPYQVTVRVRIIGGEQAGLHTEDPGPINIGPGPRSTPVRIHSMVSRSGTFTVYAQLEGADRAQWGQAVPLTIDSRAYGALTVVLMSVAGGVLLLMVIWRLAQRRRQRGGDGDDGDDEDPRRDGDTDDASSDRTAGHRRADHAHASDDASGSTSLDAGPPALRAAHPVIVDHGARTRDAARSDAPRASTKGAAP